MKLIKAEADFICRLLSHAENELLGAEKMINVQQKYGWSKENTTFEQQDIDQKIALIKGIKEKILQENDGT